MSGLAVRFNRSWRPVEAAELVAMLAAAPYRGLDGNQVTVMDNVGFGFARTIVTPEDANEPQPVLSPRTGCRIIADVRLDNRDELLAALYERPSPAIGDATLILLAYEAWGVDAPQHLLGDFAFALWDPRQQRLMLARDTSGQRPLHYFLSADYLLAASEIQQLLQDPARPVAVDEERVREYLTPFNMDRNSADQGRTYYQGISSVPAGCTLVVEPNRHRLWRYWELPGTRELRYRSDDEYAEHFRELFERVVKARLRSAGPVGAMLSGGIDSSSVVCTAQELYRSGQVEERGFQAFSLLFDGLDCDESAFIRDIEAKYGLSSQAVRATGLVASLELAPRGFLSSPGKDVSELSGIYRAATTAGVRTLLTGDLADSCTFGSRYVFDSLLRQGHLADLWRHLRIYRQLSDDSWRKIVGLYCVLPLAPLAVQRVLGPIIARRTCEREKQYLVPDWISSGVGDDLVRRHVAYVLDTERQRRFTSPARHREYGLLYPPDVGHRTAGWPVELVRPYADRRLHEFLLAIPPEQKFEPHPYSTELYAGGKLIVRRAMRGVLPESVRTRVLKTHFASLFDAEIKRRWPVYAAAFGPGGRSQVVERGYVDRERFWDRLNRLRSGEWGNDFLYLMRVMGLETWLRTLQLTRPSLVTVAQPELGRPSAAVPLTALDDLALARN